MAIADDEDVAPMLNKAQGCLFGCFLGIVTWGLIGLAAYAVYHYILPK